MASTEKQLRMHDKKNKGATHLGSTEKQIHMGDKKNKGASPFVNQIVDRNSTR